MQYRSDVDAEIEVLSNQTENIIQDLWNNFFFFVKFKNLHPTAHPHRNLEIKLTHAHFFLFFPPYEQKSTLTLKTHFSNHKKYREKNYTSSIVK